MSIAKWLLRTFDDIDVDQQAKKIKDQETTINNSAKDLKKIKKLHEKQKDTSKSLRQERTKLNNEIKILNNNNQSLEDQVESLSNEISGLQSTHSDLVNQNTDLSKRNKSLESEMKYLTEEQTARCGIIQRLNEEKEDLLRSNACLNKKIVEKSSEHKLVFIECENYKAEIETLHKTISEEKDVISKLQGQLNEFIETKNVSDTKDSQESVKRISLLSREVNELIAENTRIKKQLTQTNDTLPDSTPKTELLVNNKIQQMSIQIEHLKRLLELRSMTEGNNIEKREL